MDLWPVLFLVCILLIPLEFTSPFVLSGVGAFTAQSPFVMMLLRIAGPLPSKLSLDNTLAGSLMPLLVLRGNWWGFFPGVTWVLLQMQCSVSGPCDTVVCLNKYQGFLLEHEDC